MQQQNLQRREAPDRFEIGDAGRFLGLLVQPGVLRLDSAHGVKFDAACHLIPEAGIVGDHARVLSRAIGNTGAVHSSTNRPNSVEEILSVAVRSDFRGERD